MRGSTGWLGRIVLLAVALLAATGWLASRATEPAPPGSPAIEVGFVEIDVPCDCDHE